MMGDPRISELTEGQRACLRMVMQAMTSKEIALALAISPHTVDQRLRVAMRTLGAATRTEAARMFADAETAGGVYQPLRYQPLGLVPDPAPGTMAPVAEPWQAIEAEPEMVREPRAIFGTSADPVPKALPLPSAGRARNDLNPARRILWIVLIAILSALSFGALLNGLDGLARLFGWHR